MADSIREKGIKHLVASLQSITVANGYNVTIQAVQRIKPGGQVTLSTPYILVAEGDEATEEQPGGVTVNDLSVDLGIVVRIDDATETRSADEVMSIFRTDVEKAVKIDPKRGGNAVDTRKIGQSGLDMVPGDPVVICEFRLNIRYRHAYNDPTTLA